MEELVNQLVTKAGIDPATAQKVADFLQQHADELPKWLGKAGLADKIPGGLGGRLA